MKHDIRQFILAIVDAAIKDIQEGVSERASCNTGDALLTRLNLRKLRSVPRNADGKYARSIYTAARFLYETEDSHV